MDEFVIAHRFNGPDGSANGGYACGMVAQRVPWPVVEVTLRAPPPLDTPLAMRVSQAEALVTHNDTRVAEARPATWHELPPLFCPTPNAAEEATHAFPGHEHHLYPRCFVCGTERPAMDGLALYPGPVGGVAAAPFAPRDEFFEEGGLPLPILWAALDCPSWYGAVAHGLTDTVLLGRMTARVHRRPARGERMVVVGSFVERQGRKIHCRSELVADHQVLAEARATWIAM